MFVPIDRDTVLNDVFAITNVNLPSRSDIDQAVFLVDFEDDPQQTMIYNFVLAVIGRGMMIKADPSGDMIVGTITETHCNFGESAFGVDIKFRSKEDAMLFKLANGGAA
ncbi:hypothetical protein [Rhizobium sp.]|uniref:hypothetical protein n=1 Tax=Rhizobium sp. TaxID=391 RepID=UPI0034C6091E